MKNFEEKDLGQVISVIKNFLDFSPENYKIKPLARRIHSRMRRVGLDNYDDYAELLKSSNEEKNELKKSLTINLTSFFRNISVFDTLKTEVLPFLKNPAIWSAGCANGAEPYAIAILCKETKIKCSILGTDIDRESIKEACTGIYDESDLTQMPSYYKLKYFKKVKEGYRVARKIRNCVEFRNLDLKDINFEEEFDLIFCRNVLIYLNKEFQEKILCSFATALKENGFLVLGKVESLPNNVKKLFTPINLRDRIYAKTK